MFLDYSYIKIENGNGEYVRENNLTQEQIRSPIGLQHREKILQPRSRLQLASEQKCVLVQ